MWEARAAAYDAGDTFHPQLCEALLQRAQLQPEESVLDVATGTGMVALPAAQRVGHQGRAVGLDLAAAMLAQAEAKAAAQGLANLTFVRGDAETVEFPESSFDAVLCSSALIFLADVPAALARFRRWLKPGGRLVFNTPQEPCVPATAVFYRLLAERHGIRLADAAAPLATARVSQAALREAGYSHVQVSTTEEVMLYAGRDAAGYAEAVFATLARSRAPFTPLAPLVAPEALEATIKADYMAEVTSMALAWESPAGVHNPYTMLWVVAER